LLEAAGICVDANGRRLVDDVSLRVAPGRFLALVGPNGAGKSTLLRALSGERILTKGRIHLNGTSLSHWSTRQLAQMRAVLPQVSNLTFAFRVYEVVLMGRTPHVGKKERQLDYRVAEQALAEVSMTEFSQRIFTTLSGGEQQRVQMARVLAQVWEESPWGSRYMLLDEPTNNLDIAHQHELLRAARRLAEQGAGVLAILHDLNLAAQYADRIVFLNKGQILSAGSPKEVLTPERIEYAFAVPVSVIQHPTAACPLVVPAP